MLSAVRIPAPRFARVTEWCAARVASPGVTGQVLRKARRFGLGTFRPEQVARAIAENRGGECHRCGRCCELVYRCPFLGRDGRNLPCCRIYGDLRPSSCRNYPFDALDSEVPGCGFTFGETKRS